MPGYLVHVGAQILCPHAGQTSVISSNVRVKVAGQYVATLNDNYMIAGCPFTVPPGTPQPCLKVQWLVGSVRVKVNGQPVVLQDSTGLCLNPMQAPQGPPNIAVVQPRVKGT
ncbi:MAG: hypothetical protein JXB05_03915 [Myxococcaceae bacterium]|nr:hypothetical protein [Myxococcaceae bacterium]